MLEALLGSRLRSKVLGWLFTHPDERYFVRQLTTLVGEDSTNVSRELARLEKAGILIYTTEGKQKYYQANKQSPLFDELHGLMLKTVGVADIIKKALEPRIADIKLAFIFGSLAKRAENRFSDVDLLVVGNITFGKVADLISTAEETLKREINPVVYPVEEFKQKIRNNHHFVKTVLEEEKIFLIGDEGELGRLAE
jgi:predicted nucleotidyltransferase